jgi:hypothetical protein
VNKILAGLTITLILFIGSASFAAQACHKECVQRQKVCVKQETKCVQTGQKCVQTQQYCAQKENVCVQKNTRTGACTQYQNRCARYDQRCVQHRQECLNNQTVCARHEDKCVQEKTICPSKTTVETSAGTAKSPHRPKGKMSCNYCQASRERCFAGCKNIDNLIKQSDCVNKCNGEYPCVMGHDCQ